MYSGVYSNLYVYLYVVVCACAHICVRADVRVCACTCALCRRLSRKAEIRRVSFAAAIWHVQIVFLVTCVEGWQKAFGVERNIMMEHQVGRCV